MATLVSDVQTELAYRFGEDSAPGNAAESARRLSFINKAYFEVYKRHVWWFTQKVGSPILAIENQEAYDLPSDYRIMIEVRVNGVLYTPMPLKEAFGGYEYPQNIYNVPYGQGSNRYFVFANQLHLLPKTTANAAALPVTSITLSGQVATVVCTSHGFQNEDVISIAGAVETAYNGDFTITVVDENTFTITVTGSPSSPATGTITAQKKAIRIKYYRKATKLTASTDTVVIPDEYASAIDAFAYGRINQIDDERGSAADGFDEFEEIIKQMTIEQNKIEFWGQAARPTHPDALTE